MKKIVEMSLDSHSLVTIAACVAEVTVTIENLSMENVQICTETVLIFHHVQDNMNSNLATYLRVYYCFVISK